MTLGQAFYVHGKTVVQPTPSQIAFDLHFDRGMNMYMSQTPALGRVMTEKRFVPGKSCTLQRRTSIDTQQTCWVCLAVDSACKC